MKKFLLLLTILMALNVAAKDFSYEFEGQIITYQVISEADRTCRTMPGEPLSGGGFKGSHKISGTLFLPEEVVDTAGNSYKLLQIGNGSFADCDELNRVIFPDGITSIGDYAFYRCGLRGNLKLPAELITVSAHCFEECQGLTGSLILPKDVTYVGSGAFASCRGFNGSLVLDDNLTYIGERAFYYCTDFTGPLVIPDAVTYIGANAFYYDCHFEGPLTIPDKVTFLGRAAFGECYRLSGTLTLGSSLKTLGDIPFYGCDFGEIRCMNPTPPNHSEGAIDRLFTNLQQKRVLYVPVESQAAYKASNFAYGFEKIEPHWMPVPESPTARFRSKTHK